MSETARPSPVKERDAPVWCAQCGRHPTWAMSGTCFRCRSGRTGSWSRPARPPDELDAFETARSVPVIARFALAFLLPQAVATAIQEATLPPMYASPSVLVGTMVTTALSTIGATIGFALALGFSEKFYLPLLPRLRVGAYASAAIAFLFMLGSCCAIMSEFHPVAMFAFPLLLSAFVSAIVLEHQRNRALRIVRQGDACLTCGYTIAGAPHEVCPECGGPILRRSDPKTGSP